MKIFLLKIETRTVRTDWKLTLPTIVSKPALSQSGPGDFDLGPDFVQNFNFQRFSRKLKNPEFMDCPLTGTVRFTPF